ncbi:MAG: RNA 2'-phosphotransferase [Deltaproteobacteria bacterium]|jgi:putative RNA 2'-phosphotransferase|nr:RNA 2'-phosphotransferase [Deltaproteobacteria bacterium]
MSLKKIEHQKDHLDKNLLYILGIAPDEYGLFPDREGFVTIKELVGAVKQEDGFRSLTENRIRDSVSQALDKSSLEIKDNLIRAKPHLAGLPTPRPFSGSKPKLLYLGLKPTVWPQISKNGLKPKPGCEHSLLFPDQNQAGQVARRFIPEPVLISVNKEMAQKLGTEFFIYTERLYLATEIAPQALFGPPVKESQDSLAAQGTKAAAKKRAEPDRSGLEPEVFPGAYAGTVIHHGKKKGKYNNEPDWKNQTRKDRRREK